MYLLSYIALLIYYINIDSYIINVGDVPLTDPYTITPPGPAPVPVGLLLDYIYCLLLILFNRYY